MTGSVTFTEWPIGDLTDPYCGICQNTKEDESAWLGHEVETGQGNEKVQHVFHKSCLTDWFRRSPANRSCPLCRRAVDITNLFSEQERLEMNQSVSPETLELQRVTRRLLSLSAMASVACMYASAMLASALGQHRHIYIQAGAVLISVGAPLSMTLLKTNSQLIAATRAPVFINSLFYSTIPLCFYSNRFLEDIISPFLSRALVALIAGLSTRFYLFQTIEYTLGDGGSLVYYSYKLRPTAEVLSICALATAYVGFFSHHRLTLFFHA